MVSALCNVCNCKLLSLLIFNPSIHLSDEKKQTHRNGRREITEKAFEVTPSNLPSIIFCCIIFPYGIYHFTRKELIKKGDPRYKQSGLI